MKQNIIHKALNKGHKGEKLRPEIYSANIFISLGSSINRVVGVASVTTLVRYTVPTVACPPLLPEAGVVMLLLLSLP